MKTVLSQTLIFSLLLAFVKPIQAQKMQLGEVLIVNTPVLKSDADTQGYEAFITSEVAPVWKQEVPGVELHLLHADRGDREGDYLMVWVADTQEQRNAYLPDNDAVPFSKQVLNSVGNVAKPNATYLSQEGGYTDYVLVGADQIENLPRVDILGIHYIQVKPDKKEAFDAFVRDTLHPALADQFPDMRLLYYKGVRGEHAGSYITIFAIASVATREKYWPTNAPETETLKAAFKPKEPLALALSQYLVEGSYLEPNSGAAAAYFESLEWTDFVHIPANPR